MSVVYKRPESVLVVIYTLENKVLLLQRADVTDFWQSVTGSLEWGELPADAARREVWEETGICSEAGVWCDRQMSEIFMILPAWRGRYAPDVTHNCEHVFTLCVPQSVAIRLNPAEHLDYCWLPHTLAAQRVSSWTNQAAILRFLG